MKLKSTLFLYFLALIVLTCSELGHAKRTKKSSVRSKQENLKAFVKEDEGDLLEPYLGGFNSQKTAMLVVDFHDFSDV